MVTAENKTREPDLTRRKTNATVLSAPYTLSKESSLGFSVIWTCLDLTRQVSLILQLETLIDYEMDIMGIMEPNACCLGTAIPEAFVSKPSRRVVELM
jgi:hypothetical protein